MRGSAALIVIPALFAMGAAHADVKISSGATSNMACAGGVCSPTAKNAVLNAGDLESLLASGAVEVTTTGSGVQASNIVIDAKLSWSAANTLGLDAYRSINIEKPVSVGGTGGLTLTTNDGGNDGLLLFLGEGNITFANVTSSLSINGESYALESTLPDLANAVASNAAGAYALANSYDASQDGTYANAPISTFFTGSFNGLGNEISNLKIKDTTQNNEVYDALFSKIGTGGAVASIGVVNANISAEGNYVAGIAGFSEGLVENAFVSGVFKEGKNNSDWAAAGLVDFNFGGTIVLCHSDVNVSVVSGQNGAAGLVGSSTGAIIESYATGSVGITALGGAGGLAGGNDGTIEDSYAMVSVAGQEEDIEGGLIGANEGAVNQAYSTGAVKGHNELHHGEKGGFVGDDDAPAGSMTYAYWDTTTSNQKEGAGSPKNDPGITGLTSDQLQSGLPGGFDPTVWAVDPKINGGFPYLINNPPRK